MNHPPVITTFIGAMFTISTWLVYGTVFFSKIHGAQYPCIVVWKDPLTMQGNPPMNQPGFSGMIEGFRGHCSSRYPIVSPEYIPVLCPSGWLRYFQKSPVARWFFHVLPIAHEILLGGSSSLVIPVIVSFQPDWAKSLS